MLRSTFKFIFNTLLLTFLFVHSAKSQLVVDDNVTAQQLVQDVLVGKGVQVSNVTFTGDPIQVGRFDATQANLPLDSGVVMSTGECPDAIGPNDGDAGTGLGNQIGPNGDTDLLSIAQQTNTTSEVNDEAIIEFDFVPTGDSISFDFVFASEEYPDFVGSAYNDVFGFFLSGPGINGPYQNNAVNLAKVPGTNDPIAINNINSTTNSSYFNSNGDGFTSPYDSDSAYIRANGYTVSLTADSAVNCGDTYHLALKIADGQDDWLDSWVFLGAQSLTSDALTVDQDNMNFGKNDSTLWEGCGATTLDIARNSGGGGGSGYDTALVKPSGSATEGSDYATLPDTLFYTPSKDTASININTLYDNLAEGTENVILDLIYTDSSSCSNSDTASIEFYIEDVTPIVPNTSNDTLVAKCAGPLNIWASATGGLGNYQWSWNKGVPAGDSTGTVDPDTTTKYIVTATDTCGNSVKDSLTITVDSMNVEVAPPDTISCSKPTVDLDGSASTGVGGSIDYSWTTSGGNIASGANSATATVDQDGSYTLTVAHPASGCSEDTTVKVVQNAGLPVINVLDPDTLTCAKPVDTLDASGSTTGSGNKDFSWKTSGGAIVGAAPDSSTIQVNAPGSYTVTLTDPNNGCTRKKTLSVEMDTASPDLAMDAVDTLTCVKGNVALDASASTSKSGSLDYNWSTGASTDSIAVSSAGNYSLTITDPKNGCTDDTTVTVAIDTAKPDLQLAPVDTLSCNKTNVTLDASASTSNSGSLNYNWSSGLSSTTMIADSAGTYSLTITDPVNGCTDDTTVQVVSAGTPSITVDSTVTTSCYNGCDGKAYISVNGGKAPYSYQWGDPNSQTTQDATGLCAGTYGVTVTDDNGCQANVSVTVNEPTQVQVDPVSDTTICLNGTAVLSTSASGGNPGYTYHWDQGLGTGKIHSVSPGNTTVYTVYAEDAKGCTSPTKTVRVKYHPSLQVNASPDDSICPGAVTNIWATGNGGIGSGYSYSWSNGDTGDTITVGPSNDKDYIVTLDDGCETPVAKDTVTVKVNELPNVQIGGSDLESCEPTQPTLVNNTNSGMVGGSCTWDLGNGQTLSGCDSIQPTFGEPGCHDVQLTVTSPDGCVDSSTRSKYVCVRPYPKAKFRYVPQNATVQNPSIDFTNLSTGASSYQWTFAALDSSSQKHPTYSFPNSGGGTYSVCLKATSTYGCQDSTCQKVTIDGQFQLFVPNAFTPDGDGVNDEFGPVVQGADPSQYQFIVFDRWGQKVFETTSVEEKWDGSIKGSQSSAKTDVYVWKVITVNKYNGKQIVRKGHVTAIR